MKVTRLLETALYATDLAAAERFYVSVLGLVVVSRFEAGRGIAFGCGDVVLLVFDPERTCLPHPGVPTHGASGPGHVAFVADAAEFPRWRDHLRAHGVAIESEVSWPQGGRSLYFRDPAGNVVELAPPALWT
jgi:catechol 2,3-dioxygenase-like lactoylglutathione lyase family enzyme